MHFAQIQSRLASWPSTIVGRMARVAVSLGVKRFMC